MQKRALIVDDDLGTCNLVEGVLASLGIESLRLTGSADAADILRRVRFLVAFLNYDTGASSGTELTRKMRDSTYNRMTPVVLLSGDQRPRAMAEGFEAGATFFLYKPIERSRLLELVRATRGTMEHKLMRRIRRVPLKSRVQLWFREEEIEGETIDASLEGLLIKSSRTLPVGSSVNLRLHVGKALPPIAATGSIVRLGAAGEVGIHLGRLSLSENQRLEELLLPLLPAA
jgi:DNA-binding response OmpR family regulator